MEPTFSSPRSGSLPLDPSRIEGSRGAASPPPGDDAARAAIARLRARGGAAEPEAPCYSCTNTYAASVFVVTVFYSMTFMALNVIALAFAC